MTLLNHIIPDKLYVGIQNADNFNTETFPLGFAIPFENNAAFDKRKATVDKWSKGYDHTKNTSGNIVENQFIEGFQIEKSVSRWSTSNKWFRINDPRGFTLEISADNLCELLLNNTIENGVFKGKFIWGRANSNVWLMSETHEFFKQKLSNKLEIGILSKHMTLIQ